MRSAKCLGAVALAASVLAACSGEGNSGATVSSSTQAGTLIYNPPLRTASLNAAALAAQLGATAAGQQLLALAGAPKCGIDFHNFQYQTVGGKGEQTTASGAIMAPTGGAGCTGPLPILLYAHGTAVTRSYNLANPADPNNPAWSTTDGGSEGPIIAAMFAAQGYIVVAPNYAGFDSSPLPYHPYLVGAQQSQDMMNALAAARTAIKSGLPSAVSDSGRLFITGYSQGGYVAMATYRAMQAANMTVTAVSPMSGPYALEALLDAAVMGEVTLGSPIYFPMIANSWQNTYGNVYSALTDIYSSTYATGIDTLIPGSYTFTTLVTAGKVPQFALFSSTPTGVAAIDNLTAGITAASPIAALGFGNPYLLNNSVRILYANDAFTNPDHGLSAVAPFNSLAPWSGFTDVAQSTTTPLYGLRADARTNDLRTNWAPTVPMLLCGGHDDPEVPFAADTGVMTHFWAPYINSAPFGTTPNNLVTVLDVDPDTSASGVQTTIANAAATAFGTDLAHGVTNPVQIAADVQIAAITPFAAHFSISASGAVPIDAQGIFVGALAGVAAQAVVTYYANGTGVTNPVTMGQDVLLATVAYTHFPSEQVACEVAAKGFFAAIP
jgi:hypothetical protein